MEDKDYLPTSETEDVDSDEAPEATDEPSSDDLAQFEENEVVDCGGFSFEVTKVMGGNRYLIKVVD